MDLNLNMFALSAESSPHLSLMICVLFFHTTQVGLNSRCNQHLVTQFHLMAITSKCHAARQHEAGFVERSLETQWLGRGNEN